MMLSFSSRNMRMIGLILIFLANGAGYAYGDGGTPLQEVPGLVDLRSTFSDGTHTIEELVQMASTRGFRAVFINDHDRIALSYGIPPFRRILRYKKEFPSIMTNGPERFLEEVNRVAQKYPGIVLIPGCITSPYYYWTGSWLKNDLTLHEYDRRMVIVNFHHADDYRDIPNMHHGLSFKYTRQLLPGMFLCIVPFCIGVILLKGKGKTRIVALILVLFSALAMIDYNPFRGSLLSPYKKERGIQPFQQVIDYANQRGGLAFWNYPEQKSGIREYGPIRVDTPPYPQVLHQSEDYAGFAAIYGDRTSLTDPGKEWDRVLHEFCQGKRRKAPWAIATADFHQDGRLGQKLGAFPTTFLVRDFSKQGILEAMSKGRMYASSGDGHTWLTLDSFAAFGNEGEKALMGETLTTSQFPSIRFRVSHAKGERNSLSLLLIRGGAVLQKFQGQTPFEAEYVDKDLPPGKKTYYRLMDSQRHLISNPIFVLYHPASPP
jgi:hypothetical protein